MLRQRIITGLVLAIVFAGVILQNNSLWISLLFAVVLFAATWELLALTINPGRLASGLIATGLVMLFGWSLTVIDSQLLYWQSLAGLAIWLLIAMYLPLYRYSGKWPLSGRVLLLGLGLDLLWICVHGLIYLHQHHGGWILLYLLTLVWVADTGAYFSGRKFGKHKLAPAISPGKTWEGVAGGIFANLLWMLLVYQMLGSYQLHTGLNLSLIQFLLIGLATSFISVVGDLFESILKRQAGVKDSGKLLPGHGGVLDRIDSIIAASPVFVAGLMLVDKL
jgi:phosphatidate cytidylyltransferase